MTGAISIGGSLAPKRLELLRALVCDAPMALLINPDTPLGVAERKDAEAASQALRQRLEVAQRGYPLDGEVASPAILPEDEQVSVSVNG